MHQELQKTRKVNQTNRQWF